jgi:hypothetical protein
MAMRITETRTTFVEEATSSRLGQVTFLSSAKLSLKNRIIFFICFLSGASGVRFFQKKEAGQAGLEPATSGFGDRRSSQLELLAFRKSLLLYLGFPVQGVLSVKLAVLLELQLPLDVPLVFTGCIIPAVAFGTL